MEDFYEYASEHCDECKLYGDDEYIRVGDGEVVWKCETCHFNPDNWEESLWNEGEE